MTRDPFHIDGPATINFSGGRTSAYMLWRILQAHGGILPDDVRVCFANTGKEMPETLDFIRDVGDRWGVPIHWLEYRWRPGQHYFVEVDHASASRKGEPFDLVIEARSLLPNPIMRFCTGELKIGTMRRYALSLGYEHLTNVVGLRADEPQRVHKMKERQETNDDGWEVVMPLAAAGITKHDVAAFWRGQNFDLQLTNVNGTSPRSNCDLCFLKPTSTLMGLIRERPELAAWWIDKERWAAASPTGQKMRNVSMSAFRKDRPSYAQMLDAVQRQETMDFGDLDQRIDCFCSEDT